MTPSLQEKILSPVSHHLTPLNGLGDEEGVGMRWTQAEHRHTVTQALGRGGGHVGAGAAHLGPEESADAAVGSCSLGSHPHPQG